jgi:hypothetical protein
VRLPVADLRVDPVPGCRGVDELECPKLTFPILERGDVDLDRQAREIATRVLGKLPTHLDADDGEAALEHGSRGLAGRAPDLEDRVARLEPSKLDNVIEEFLGVRRSRRLIEVGSRIERAPEWLPGLAHRPIVRQAVASAEAASLGDARATVHSAFVGVTYSVRNETPLRCRPYDSRAWPRSSLALR